MGKSKTRVLPRGPKIGAHGELVPTSGFSRLNVRLAVPGQTPWVSHDGLLVVSSLEQAHLPGSGDPPLVGPQWLVSVSRRTGGREARCQTTRDDVARVVDSFAMPAFDQDNHHPGVARHLWCPVDPKYQQACECKISEVTITDGDYAWTTEPDHCRGCEYQRLFGAPCPIHKPEPSTRSEP